MRHTRVTEILPDHAVTPDLEARVRRAFDPDRTGAEVAPSTPANSPTTKERGRAMTDATRTAYIEGMRTLLDALEQHPEIPLPYEGNATAMTFHFLSGEDPKAEMAAAARGLPCTFAKDADDKYFDMDGHIAGVKVRLVAFRDAVCERVVTGTREVEVEEQDPEALAAVPTRKVTKVVEDVEWRCAPVLVGTEASTDA